MKYYTAGRRGAPLFKMGSIKDIKNSRKKILIIAIFFILFLIASGLSLVFLVIEKNKLSASLTNTKDILESLRQENKRAQTDKERFKKESEKLRGESVSYLYITTRLKQENSELQTELEGVRETIESNEAELKQREAESAKLKEKIEQSKEEIEGLLDKSKDEFSAEIEELQGQFKELKAENQQLQAHLKQERALYHYNLGVAYSQTQAYDDALKEYEKSLSYNLNNAEAHYNLGLIYEHIKNNPEKAIQHYKQYIDLAPQAYDIREVNTSIRKLEESKADTGT